MDSKKVSEDEAGQLGAELQQCGVARRSRFDPKVAQARGHRRRAHRLTGPASREKPEIILDEVAGHPSWHLLWQSLDQIAQRWREEDVILTEPEPYLVLVGPNARASQPNDAGGRLGVKEQQQRSHPVARFHPVICEEAACDVPSLVIANEAERVSGRRVPSVEIGEESSSLCPANEAG